MEIIQVTSPPTVMPVDVSTMHAHLRLNDTSEDSLLSDWIEAAADLFTRQTRYVLGETQFSMNLDGWPVGYIITIPRWPVTAVGDLTYLQPDASWATIDPSTYSVDISGCPARVCFKPTFTTHFVWPLLHYTEVPKVKVAFTAGYTDAADMPKLAKTAVKMLVAHWYRSRETHGEANLNETPMGWNAVCDQFKSGLVGSLNEAQVV